jgi:ribosomal protein S18 acetylase RimI-like enzyme
LSHSRSIASVAVVVDAKDDAATAFYEKYGFIEMPEHHGRLFLPMESVALMFAA